MGVFREKYQKNWVFYRIFWCFGTWRSIERSTRGIEVAGLIKDWYLKTVVSMEKGEIYEINYYLYYLKLKLIIYFN